MSRLFLAVAVLATLSVAFATSNELGSQELFAKYVRSYGKVYNVDELTQRFKVFQHNLDIINAHNAGGHSWTMGINEFTDLTEEEVAARLMPATLASEMPRDDTCHPPPARNKLPSNGTVDWRKRGLVTYIKNQGKCGSCWAFAATAGVEAVHARNGKGLESFSAQHMVDCDTKGPNQGCGGGWSWMALDWVKQNGGLAREGDYPYVAKQNACNTSVTPVAQVKGYRCFQDDSTQGGAEKGLEELIETGPVMVSIHASSDYFRSYKSGVLDTPLCYAERRTNHAVTVVAYGTEKGLDYWVIKNSWGADWGDHGYVKLARGKNTCGIGHRVILPI